MPIAFYDCNDEIVGNSVEIVHIKHGIDRVASSDAPILITGETGTGKELFARRVHRLSKRSSGPFISVNCAAIPDNLLESELFGFEKGAFTGATSDRKGVLAEAEGGTVFLDEIGDLSLCAQAKLLRVIEQREVRPLGSRMAKAIDFRLVAATNRNLEQMTSQGQFRQDLYFRINVIRFRIPPLRERREDIPLIADHFLGALNAQYPETLVSLTEAAKRDLKQFHWTGNVRELRNVLERAFLLSNSSCITEQDIAQVTDLAIHRSVRSGMETLTSFRAAPETQPERRVNRTHYRHHRSCSSGISEVDQLRKALEETHWNKSEAAKLLCCSRMTLYRKVAYYELRPVVSSDALVSSDETYN